MKKVIFSEEQEQDIISLYSKQETLKNIGAKYNVSRSIIKRLLNEHNIPTRPRVHSIPGCYDKFNKIDSREKAYWLGFLSADGCNYRRKDNSNATIAVNLSRKDRGHLVKFCEFLNLPELKIKDFVQDGGFSSKTEMSRVGVYSLKMSYDLERWGVPPRKSLILKPPTIKPEFFTSYILGYFDGDGCISHLSATGCFQISFVGTKELLNWIEGLSGISFNYQQRYPEKRSNNYDMRIAGTHKPYAFLHQLYTDCPVYLERKYKLFKQLEQVVMTRNSHDNHSVNCWKPLKDILATA